MRHEVCQRKVLVAQQAIPHLQLDADKLCFGPVSSWLGHAGMLRAAAATVQCIH